MEREEPDPTLPMVPGPRPHGWGWESPPGTPSTARAIPPIPELTATSSSASARFSFFRRFLALEPAGATRRE